MNSPRSLYLAAALAAAVTTALQAQVVYPVALSGAGLPPARSLDLSVYALERAQDVMFTATLADPTEPRLDVKLRLSVEQGGQVLYRTDPNNGLPPITLAAGQPLVINGRTLAPYLRFENLLGSGGGAPRSLEVPEGFIDVCVEVYGVQRVVPVSRKICLTRYFRLNQVPLPILPAQGAQIERKQVQNLLFTWTPRHLGSGNAPRVVNYEFELVRLPRGYYNANDAFRASRRIITARVTGPSYVYGPTQPLLDTNAVYAWRVRAFAPGQERSLLFQNDGYAEIQTFYYYGSHPIDDDITPFDNPSPLGCSVFATDYPALRVDEGEARAVSGGDRLKLGYFTMRVTEAKGAAGSYDGRGLVEFPVLNAKIPVRFEGLRVNLDSRVVAADLVEAEADERIVGDREAYRRIAVDRQVTPEFARDLADLLGTPEGATRRVSGLNLADDTGRELPLAIDREGVEPVVVTGIRFTPRVALLNAVSWERDDAGNYAPYVGTNIRATPYGVKSRAHLVSLAPAAGDGEIAPTVRAGRARGAKMYIDCQGFHKVEGRDAFVTDARQLLGATYGSPVELTLPRKPRIRRAARRAAEAAWSAGTYVGPVEFGEAVALPSIAGVRFTADEIYVDLSAASALALDGGLPAKMADPRWRGIALRAPVAELPAGVLPEGQSLGFAQSGGWLIVGADGPMLTSPLVAGTGSAAKAYTLADLQAVGTEGSGVPAEVPPRAIPPAAQATKSAQ